jgi:hypothetical protein
MFQVPLPLPLTQSFCTPGVACSLQAANAAHTHRGSPSPPPHAPSVGYLFQTTTPPSLGHPRDAVSTVTLLALFRDRAARSVHAVATRLRDLTTGGTCWRSAVVPVGCLCGACVVPVWCLCGACGCLLVT